jgi:aminopeptidase N
MEHPGAILYNERRIFLGPSPTTSERLSRTELIAHETSHLWFGDAVTMRWFNDVWTKEVFANYFASKITTPLYPEVNVPLRDFRSFNIPAYAEDRTGGTNAIRRELPNLSSAGLIYGNIVYDKAPVVMRMLSDILGDEAFRDGIREYLQTFLYGNADWNELVAILDKRTETDLKRWSRVWVEEKGMPTIDCTLAGDTLTVRQEDPLGRGLVWPQRISWADETGETVASIWSDAQAVTRQLPGKGGILLPDPDALSYGWFRLDTLTARSALKVLPGLARPESRLSLLATLHENALRGEIPPDGYIELLGGLLRTERDPLVCGAVTSYLKTLAVHGPAAGSPQLERLLLEAASDLSLPDEIRLTAFRALAGVSRTDETRDLLRTVFLEEKGYKGLKLGERDYLTLSYELALRCPGEYGRIRSLEEGRIQNPDLLREFRFIYPAVNPDREVRDSLFAALLEPGSRAVEPWAASALAYLNHPLRQKEAAGYLYPALEELPEIQRTGDIFFPKNWCSSLLDGHDSPQAAAEVRRYLEAHPELPELLKVKLLQSADHLLRAEK